ncbi:MAG: polysaccharide deacetylase family protein [Chloroflexota bacterium]|nr:polysaccharide deacetylase family protein [Chloroflexota bacterium]
MAPATPRASAPTPSADSAERAVPGVARTRREPRPTITPAPTETPRETATSTPMPSPTRTPVPTATPEPLEPYYVAASGYQAVNLRRTPGTSSPVLVVMPYGARVQAGPQTVRSSDGSPWRRVAYGHQSGYASAALLSRTRPPAHPPVRALSLPVLEYHDIGRGTGDYDLPVSAFAAQLDWLRANGYTTVTLSQVYEYMFSGGSLPAKPVVISFDDGRVSQWNAVEQLNLRGMLGVFFVMERDTGMVLSDAQLQQMVRRGHDIESHTMTHRSLTKLSAQERRHAESPVGARRAEPSASRGVKQ